MPRDLSYTHLNRYREVARILADEGLGALAVRLGVPESFRSRHHEPDSTTPERIRHALERIGPVAVKAGQMLSTRPDIVPEEYRLELRRLQDRVAPVSFEEVCRVIEAELGAPPDQVFARFEHEPMASASIGQVHAATLTSGEEVAVKVQRPGILAHAETDLEIMLLQAKRLDASGLVQGVTVAAVAEEFVSAIRAELDYLTEAENAERFAQVMAASDSVKVPRVFPAYCTRKVLTMERLEGIPFNRPDLIDEARIDRHDLAVRGVQAYLTQIFEIGVFHADPHPGNLFAMTQNRVGFTDFGRIGTVPQGLEDTTADLLLGIVDRDADLAADALLAVSMDGGQVDFEVLRQDISLLVGKYYGVELAAIRVGELLEDLLDLVRQHRLSLPPKLAVMMATLAVLEGVGHDLDPRFDFVEAVRPYAQRLQRRELAPEELARGALRASRRLVRAASELPSSVDRALRRVAGGEFRIAVRPEDYGQFLDRVEELADRLAFAVLVGAFVIGFSTLLSVEWLPTWLKGAMLVGMLGALGVSSWMFVSLLLARWRGRGHP